MLEKAKTILNVLNKAGYEAYIVGGAVRDCLLGLNPSDIDIATNAIPKEVINLFPKTYPSGIKFGTVTVIIDGEDFEVTTFRTDGEYLDGRRPEVVVFGESIEEDLSRRDFTINAMAMDVNGKIVDLFGGQNDLEKGIIKAVGNPTQRFSEDALRILRAFRFSARFGFKIETETLNAIEKTKEGLKFISPERIREEVTKILLTDNTTSIFFTMYETGVLEIILPEIAKIYGVEQNNPYHVYDIFTHTMKAIEHTPKDLVLRWAMLLHDVGKADTKETIDGVDHFYKHNVKSVEIAEKILDRLNFSNKIKNEILELIKLHDRPIQPTSKAVRRLLNQLQYTSLDNLLTIKEADYKAQNWEHLDEKLNMLNQIKDIAQNEEKITVKDLKVNGYDLMELGLKGKEIGNMQKYLLDLVLDNPIDNNKNTLLKFAKTKIQN